MNDTLINVILLPAMPEIRANSPMNRRYPVLEADEACQRLAQESVCPVLLAGAPGSGKSMLAGHLAEVLATNGRDVFCISADPGIPAFGPPGAVSLGQWRSDHWQLQALEPLCTLDAARFRLPLIQAVARLTATAGKSYLLIDSPGLVRSTAALEALPALVDMTRAARVLMLASDPAAPPLESILGSLQSEVWIIQAHEDAHRPAKRQRDSFRTRQWDAWLEQAQTTRIPLEKIALTGTPPPRSLPDAWRGHQAGLIGDFGTVMGEIESLEEQALVVRAPPLSSQPQQVIVRDAVRNEHGQLTTAVKRTEAQTSIESGSAPDAVVQKPGGPVPTAHVGPVIATLVNGVYGDPLLRLRLQHQRRSLLFDLGDASRLATKTLHQVSDVFISHAHADHIGGFMTLLRARIGEFPVCRFYGPPGLAGHVAGMVNGILWDRVGDRAPRFAIGELHGNRLKVYNITAGNTLPEYSLEAPADDGVILIEAGFRIRAVTLDHGTPVLAFALETDRQLNVRRDQLEAMGLEPGPWLTELKQHIANDERDALIELPNATRQPAGELADALLFMTPGQKLAYATDLADTVSNRERLVELARHAHTFFCESPFMLEAAGQAEKTGHLTTRACGEIASAANVKRLVPFHFSSRHEHTPAKLYGEVKAACSQTMIPGGVKNADLQDH